MGRKTIEINLDKLKDAINVVEANGPLANLSALYTQVSELMITNGEANVNPQLVMLRINKLGIPVKTQKGKRGRQPGQKIDLGSIPRGRKKMQEEVRAGLLASGPSGGKNQISVTAYRKLVNKAAGGSIKARLTLKCLECADYQREEIRYCGCEGTCPLYDIRPFKTSEEKANVSNS